MPYARFTRKSLHGRPRAHKVGTSFGWLKITHEDKLDVIECEMSTGQAAALTSRGWTLDRTKKAPSAKTPAPAAPAATPAPPAPAAPAPKSALPDVSEMTTDEFDEWMEANDPSAEETAVLIAQERKGKKRKTVLRALGVEV